MLVLFPYFIVCREEKKALHERSLVSQATWGGLKGSVTLTL